MRKRIENEINKSNSGEITNKDQNRTKEDLQGEVQRLLEERVHKHHFQHRAKH